MPTGYVSDIASQRFGRLVALDRHRTVQKKTKWRCRCDCGNEVYVLLDSLKRGRSKSCGCLRKELVSAKFKKYENKDKRLYDIWLNIKQRCSNENRKSYKDYGGRGIQLCEEWHDFNQFSSWALENGYHEELTIDRIDNDGDYTPENCRWTDRHTQANNTRKNVFTEIEGVTRTLAEHAEFYDINYYTLHYRYTERDLRGEDLIKPSERQINRISYNGQTKTIKEWSLSTGLPHRVIYWRYCNGKTGSELFEPLNEQFSQNAKKQFQRREKHAK